MDQSARSLATYLIMASRGEFGWQSEKTLAECMRYMLDNEIATDVCFEVGPTEGATVIIRAHKYMLISRSPVFEAMFSSGMTEMLKDSEAKIRIVDISAEVFRLLLSFIYCDFVRIDLGSAPTLLYAARKYLLPRLSECCSQYLQSVLNTSNVIEILELGVNFDVESLKRKCLTFFANNSETVLNGDEMLTLSRQSLESILKMNRIMSGPPTLFNSCVKWAKYQLQMEQYVEAPNYQQIRKFLGSLLYEIPFSAISATEFANLVGENEVLTTREKSAVYYYLASRKGKDKLKFSTENRHEHLVNLATKCTKGFLPQSLCTSCSSFKKSPFEISFKTDKSILLTGLGLYTVHDGADYAVDIQINQEAIPLMQEKRIVPYTESSTIVKVSFDEPVPIDQGKLYKISALANKAIGYYCEMCNEILVDNVTFTFVADGLQPNQHRKQGFFGGAVNNITTSGQILQLYFISLSP